MADIKKYLDLEGLKTYDEKIKALIKDAGKTEEEIKAIIAEVVGSLPEDATESTILAYLENKIKAVDDKVGDISTLTSDTVTSLAQALSAELARAADAEDALDGRLDTIEADYLKTSDKYDDTALKARVKTIEDDYLKKADKYDDTELAGKVDTLIGDDGNKSVRTIAAEELAKQLVPENAKDSLDTLEEIAAWIQAHPDDASAMSADIEALKAQVGTKAVAAVTHEATQEDVDANKATKVGDTVVDTPAVAATGIEKEIADLDNSTDARLDALEIAAGLKGDDTEKTVAERVTAIENALADTTTFEAISDDEISELFETSDEATEATDATEA